MCEVLVYSYARELILCCESFFRRRVRTRKLTKKTPTKKALVKDEVMTPTKERMWTPPSKKVNRHTPKKG